MVKLKDQISRFSLKKQKYNKPKISINKVYTKSGDGGDTYIVGGHKVSKSSLRIESFGIIEELVSSFGSCIVIIAALNDVKVILISNYLHRLQHELFNLGNMLSTLEKDYSASMPQVNEADLEYMEKIIDEINVNLPSLDSFVLPGGSELNVRFHQARTLCRRCERTIISLSKKEEINSIIIPYINRLSDLLFVLSRWANIYFNKEENTWNPNYKK